MAAGKPADVPVESFAIARDYLVEGSFVLTAVSETDNLLVGHLSVHYFLGGLSDVLGIESVGSHQFLRST